MPNVTRDHRQMHSAPATMTFDTDTDTCIFLVALDYLLQRAHLSVFVLLP